MNSANYKQIIEKCKTPVFIYSELKLKENIKRIKNAISESGLENRIGIYAAYFTNSNPHIFKILSDENLGCTLQTIEEWYHLKEFGLEKMDIIMSPTVLSDEDLSAITEKDIQVNVTLPCELEFALKKSEKIGLRIDITAEQNQRTGLKINEFQLIDRIFEKNNKKLRAIHTYPGTGSDFAKIITHAEEVFIIYNKFFSSVKEINLGGGFAFEYAEKDPEKRHFQWKKYFLELKKLIDKYQIPKNVKISIEPGREIFADAGEFVIKINRIHKRQQDRIHRLYTDGSYVYMPSASIRKRQHELKFIDKNFNEIKDRSGFGELSGSTTLSSDYIFPGVVRIPNQIEEDTYIAVQDIGAYGASQHMEFLNKRPAAEILVKENNKIELISERGNFTDKTRHVPAKTKRISD